MVSSTPEKQKAEIDYKALQTNSSLQTVFTLTNCMIGGTMLLLPTLTLQSGILTAPVCLAITGFVSYITCSIYAKHMKESEMDIQWTIKRILGNGWYLFFVITCSIYKFFVCQLYFFYVVDLTFQNISFILIQCGVDPDYIAKESDFTFKQFSTQYVILIIIVPLFVALSYRNLKKLVKLTEYGVYAIYAYIGFIFYCLFTNFKNINNSGPMPLNVWTWNIGDLGGTAALAFTIHTSFGNMIKCNKNQKNNVRDLGFAYMSGCSVYMVISVVGALGIINRLDITDLNNLPEKMTYFFGNKNWGPFFVQTLYLFNLLSVLPIFWDVTKRRFIPLINKGKEQASDQMNYIINVVFLVLSVLIKSIPGISLSQITSINGALNCFFFVYLIPIIMHFTCYHGKNPLMRKMQRTFSQVTETAPLPLDYQIDEIPDDNSAANSFVYGKQTDENINEDLLKDSEKFEIDTSQIGAKAHKHHHHEHRMDRAVSCANHDDVELTNKALIIRFIFYGFIGLIGLLILVQGMYSIITDFIK